MDWTYAQRLVRRVDAAGVTINPLQTIIARLTAEAKNGGPKRARYELNLVDPFTDLSTSDPTLPGDKLALGGPCLSHLSFKLRPGGSVSLTAFYRSHFYVERALGNLIGLSRLLSFVARESGLEAGTITCISSYAQIDASSSITKVDKLIRECKELLAVDSQSVVTAVVSAVIEAA